MTLSFLPISIIDKKSNIHFLEGVRVLINMEYRKKLEEDLFSVIKVPWSSLIRLVHVKHMRTSHVFQL